LVCWRPDNIFSFPLIVLYGLMSKEICPDWLVK
jgi:hypothetical protein